MLKKELGGFQLFALGEKLGEVRLPFSLSAIEWPGEAPLSLETPMQIKERLMREYSWICT